MIDEKKIREMVRRVVLRTVEATEPPPRRGRALITRREVESVPAGGRLETSGDAIVTPLARQAAMERKVAIRGQAVPGGAALRGEGGAVERTVAIAADHGGYEMKEMLKDHLRGRGLAVMDCGTDGTAPVDYPDFAFAAARLVGQGRAASAIVVDGAGIGSCIAANKVPGIRAAMCYDEATAVNSREHNGANVLTLGAGLLGSARAKRIVDTWLDTPAGGGRHARRVAKIMDIERRYSRV